MSNVAHLPNADLARQQLVTIDPTAYVEAVYQPFNDRLASAVAEWGNVEVDVTTSAGLKLATEGRRVFRELRIETEKERKDRKAPILEIGRLLDGKAKALAEAISDNEQRFDGPIKEQEARKEEERQAKIRAEEQRLAGIQTRIDAIRARADAARGLPSADVQSVIDDLHSAVYSDNDFQERMAEAEAARQETMERLNGIKAEAVTREAEDAQRAAERAELDRLRKEQAERDQADAKRRAEEQAKLDAERAAMRAQQEEADRKANAERAEIERQRRELEAQKAEQDRRQREAEEAEARALAARQKADAEKAERRARAKNRPSDDELAGVVADYYAIDRADAVAWLSAFGMEKAA